MAVARIPMLRRVRLHAQRLHAGVGLLVVLLAAGCSHVPKEAVQLSYQVGQDLPRLHESYDALIQGRFADFRARRNAYVDEVWAPDYIRRWIENGRLVDVAKGGVVWSFDTGSFVPPTVGKEKTQLLATVQEWANAAVAEIANKRSELLGPLDKEEKELRALVAEAYGRVIQANAYITAHLASLQSVEQQQDEALKALQLKDLRDKIDAALAKASADAATGLDAVKKADGLLDKAGDARKRLH